MDKDAYKHYLNILLDKLNSIKRVGLSAIRIHDIDVDICIINNWLSNMSREWFDILDTDKKIDTYATIDRAINRIENDLIEFIKW